MIDTGARVQCSIHMGDLFKYKGSGNAATPFISGNIYEVVQIYVGYGNEALELGIFHVYVRDISEVNKTLIYEDAELSRAAKFKSRDVALCSLCSWRYTPRPQTMINEVKPTTEELVALIENLEKPEVKEPEINKFRCRKPLCKLFD